MSAPLIDSGYLSAVHPSRALANARVDRLEAMLTTGEATLEFMLRFLALRSGPLADIPKWLELSARACRAKHPAVADDLLEAAALEREHHELLIEDLDELLAYAGRSEVTLPDDPRMVRHMRVRAMVPARSEPLIVLPIDLELAVLGCTLGPMLVLSCRQRLPRVDGGRFIRARETNAFIRAGLRDKRLRGILANYPDRGPTWAKVATEVTHSYLGALEACAGVPLSIAA